jgi:hypothetical protein
MSNIRSQNPYGIRSIVKDPDLDRQKRFRTRIRLTAEERQLINEAFYRWTGLSPEDLNWRKKPKEGSVRCDFETNN